MTAATVMRMEAGLDTGPICRVQHVPNGPDTTAGARLANMRDFYVFTQESLPSILDEWAERKAQLAAES